MSLHGPTAPKWMIAVGWIGRLVVAGVFLFAGVQKLLAPDTFAQDIANYQAFPHWTWNLAAAIVPITEVLGALAVLTDFKRRAATIVLGALNVAFIGLDPLGHLAWHRSQLRLLRRCGEASSVGWPMLLRDLGLMLAIAAAYLPPSARRRVNASRPRSRICGSTDPRRHPAAMRTPTATA